jgi:hypothetical protein
VVWISQPAGSSLPGGNLVVTATREAALITAKAASITTAKAASVTTITTITTKTSVAEAASVATSITTETSAAEAASVATSITTETSVTEAASVAPEASTGAETIVGLIVAAITPFDRVRVRRLELLKEFRHNLLGLEENLHEIFSNIFVAVIVEGCGLALIADTSCTTNAMNILSDAIILSRWQVVVDDVLDIRDIKAASGHAGSNENWATSGAEGTPE